ncbi:uroporphyrinogen-III synthase [Salibacterium sp. K-3]
MTKPLRGRTVLITRPPAQAPVLQRLIEEEGGSALVLPMIETVRTADWDTQMKRAGSKKWDWIVFTSANAVSYFDALLREASFSLSPSFRTAAVGQKTAEALHEKGWPSPVIPARFDGDGLAELLQNEVKPGHKVLFPKSARGRHVIPDALQKAGGRLYELPLYTSVPARGSEEQLKPWIDQERIDYLTFTSPSAVKAFVQFLKDMPPGKWKNLNVVSIGPVTDEEAKRQGMLFRRTAEPSTVEGLVRTLTAFAKEEE